MSQLGVWRIGERGPERVPAAGIDFEAHLESWIEADPDLLEAGLRIVGRQVGTEGGVIDLLALDPQGRWGVIEVKRGRLYRDTLAQALDYASCIAAMSPDELQSTVSTYLREHGKEQEDDLAEEEEGDRELRVCVVGLSRDPSLDRVAEFLANRYGVAIKAVTFEAYNLGGGERVLVRQLSEVEIPVTGSRKWTARSVKSLTADAEANGIGPQFRTLLEAGERCGLYLRPWKTSVMVTPPGNRSRMLYTLRSYPTKAGQVRMWLAPEAFAEFYPSVTEEEAIGELGSGGRLALSPDDVERFAFGPDQLLARVRRLEHGPWEW